MLDSALLARDMNISPKSVAQKWSLDSFQRRFLLLLSLTTFPLLPAMMCAQQDTISQARSLAASGHLEEANELLSEEIQHKPQDVALLQELGSVQLSQQLYDDALNSFGSALSLQPDSRPAQSGEVRAAVADALLDRNAGNQDGALSCLLRAKKLVPDSVELLTDFGIQADSMELYKDADDALTQAHRLAPEDSRALLALAHVELDEQKMPEAEANLRAYLRIKPDDASAHYGLGHLLHMMVKNDEATQELERSIELRPQQTESYYELGEIALDQGQNDKAKKEFVIVLQADPRHGGALTGMGIIAYRNKQYPVAEGYFSKAVLYAPDYAPAHQFYAMTLARLGRQEESEREMAQARKLSDAQNRLRHGYVLEQTP
jgi:tetratricopeptide (TPR) repeat protein